MGETWILSALGGTIFALAALLARVLILRWSGHSADLQTHFGTLDASKHEVDMETEPQSWQRSTTLGFLLLYGAAIGVAMTFVLRLLYAVMLEFRVSALIVTALWLGMAMIPVVIEA